MNKTGSANPNWRGGPPKFICEWCKKSFAARVAKGQVRRFCTRPCRTAWDRTRTGPASPKWKGGRKKPLPKPRKAARVWLCGDCSKPVPRRSKRCTSCRAMQPRKQRTIRCGGCRKQLITYNPRQRRCIHCLDRKGARNANWKGGKTSANAAFRKSPEYVAWRTAVFERDDYTCLACGQHGGRLHADHIKPFSTHPKLRLRLSNGRTLCIACHKRTDTYLSGALRFRRRAS